MFLVSNKLEKLINCPEYKIVNENPVRSLALATSVISIETCVFIDDEKFISNMSNNVKMVITTGEIYANLKDQEKGVVITDNPRILFFLLHNALKDDMDYVNNIFETRVSSNADISELSYINKTNVIIEDEVIIEPFVTIYPNVTIKKGSIIRSGARIGGVGFEFKRYNDMIISVEHFGGVDIGENVEIQNNTCIDCGVYPWDNTIIGDNTKIDNLVYIAHGCKIDKNVMIVANTGIGGRTIVYPNSWIGIGATIRNGIEIGGNSRVNMGAVVSKTVEQNQSVSGNYAIDHVKFLNNLKDSLK